MTWAQKRRSEEYYRRAKKEGFRSRASYKLLQVHEKFHLIDEGTKILDMGASPGGWSQVISKLNPDGLNVATDIIPMDPVPGVIFSKGDIFSDEVIDRLLEKSEFGYDLILSDILQHTSGQRSIDHANSYFIAKRILEMAERLLNRNGKMLVKMLQGDLTDTAKKEYMEKFRKVRITKPPSSSPSSSEVYILAEGFLGGKRLR